MESPYLKALGLSGTQCSGLGGQVAVGHRLVPMLPQFLPTLSGAGVCDSGEGGIRRRHGNGAGPRGGRGPPGVVVPVAPRCGAARGPSGAAAAPGQVRRRSRPNYMSRGAAGRARRGRSGGGGVAKMAAGALRPAPG